MHGTDYGIQGLRWASRFDDQMRAVPQLRQGRVLLVGESARIHYPSSGVGMNFCLQDAFNLGWKLALVVRGLAGDAVLDTYESERLPVMHALLESVKAQCALQFSFGPEAVALKRRMAQHIVPLPDVQRKLVLELCGLEAPYRSEPGSHALAGHRMPDIDLLLLDGRSASVTQLLRERHFCCSIWTARAGSSRISMCRVCPSRCCRPAPPMRRRPWPRSRRCWCGLTPMWPGPVTAWPGPAKCRRNWPAG